MQTFCKTESIFHFNHLSLLFFIYKTGKLFHQEVIKCWHSLSKEFVGSPSLEVSLPNQARPLNNLI